MRTANRLSLIVLIAFVFAVPDSRAFQAGGSLPARIADTDFWKLSQSISEPDGAFFSENFLSNERGFQYVIPALLERVKPGGVYMGVGPEQNFTYIAVLQPKLAFVVDIRRQNMMEHLLYKAVFELSPTRAEFLSRLLCRAPASSLPVNANPEALFAAFNGVPQDDALFTANLKAVMELLVKKHGFALSADDMAGVGHVYSEFANQGTNIGYSVSDAQLMAQINVRAREQSAGNSIVTPQPSIAPAPPASNPPSVTIDVPTDLQAIFNANGTIRFFQTAPQPSPSFPNYTELMMATDASGQNWSYLSTEERYRTVREMQLQNRIVPIVGDFAGPQAIREVGKYLRSHDAKLTAFYLSNVEQYLNPSDLKHFYDNVAAVPLDASSTFIRSAQGSGAQPGIVQSYISPMQVVIDAVISGDVRSLNDIIRIWH